MGTIFLLFSHNQTSVNYLILLWSAYSHPKNLNFSTFQANSFFSHANGRKILQELHTESERNSAHRSWQLLLMTLITNKQFFMKLGHKIWILPNQRISNVYYVNFSSVASLLTRRLNADTNVTPTLGRGRDVGWSTATRLATQCRAATSVQHHRHRRSADAPMLVEPPRLATRSRRRRSIVGWSAAPRQSTSRQRRRRRRAASGLPSCFSCPPRSK